MRFSYGGEGIKAFAEALLKEVEDTGQPRDWSVDVAYHLAMALISLGKLEEMEVKLDFRNRWLVEPHLEEAWRELVYLRTNRLSDEIKRNDIKRRVRFSFVNEEVRIDEGESSTVPRQKRGSRGDGKAGTKTEGELPDRSVRFKHRVYRRDK